jgi:nucleoside-diphosphate-sugar epimerase
MQAGRAILLTGATGFLGRYLLRDLLRAGHAVAVLVRDSHMAPAADRVKELVAFGSASSRISLPAPTLLVGDLTTPGLGLDGADRRWLATHSGAVLHAAAHLGFRRTADGEPWTTNVGGTQYLLELCADLGLTEFHHISTAFVCGDRTGTIREDELDRDQRFHNDYEQSKFEAEQRVRQCRALQTTIYRPSIIVGDSGTGYTAGYSGIYKLIELVARLAEARRRKAARHPRGRGTTSLALRLPGTGAEPRNLIPVDWVAQAVVRLMARPDCHERTYHLTSPWPVRSRDIKEVAEDLLGIDGIGWAGSADLPDPTALEQLFLDQCREYLPYRHGDPAFDCRNTRQELPQFLPPRMDRALLTRLIQFAIADNWGRSRLADGAVSGTRSDCSRYIEEFFPQHIARFSLAQTVRLTLTVGLDLRGPGGGQWTCRWTEGELVDVQRGLSDGVEVIYRTDPATFSAVVEGRQTPQQAFFTRRIEIEGNLETGLKLAVLFGQFVREFPYPIPENREAMDATPLFA